MIAVQNLVELLDLPQDLLLGLALIISLPLPEQILAREKKIDSNCEASRGN
jgi:hypothetical protein